MNILIIGSGAREHAIASALHRSPQPVVIHCCGISVNPGIKQMSHRYWVGNTSDVEAITQLAIEWQITLAIIGPEAPLEKGLADALWAHSIPTIGPKKQLAQIETSKSFARELMKKYAVPGLPRFKAFNSMAGVSTFLQSLGEGNYVVKADGLMGGKGVKVAGDHLASIAEAESFCESIFAQQQNVLIEEKLIGQEFSLMCFCDGNTIIPMPLVQDHKRAFEDDKGPNTGGMGSYSDADHSLPFLDENDVAEALAINIATLKALMAELQDRYIGILYGSFIATRHGVQVIEFNARLGDPEALNVLSILESDFAAICQAMVTGSLSKSLVRFAPLATVCKYAVPIGYPDAPKTLQAIDVSAVSNKSHLYFAGVDAVDGTIYATGARAIAYVGVAHCIITAEECAEKEICGVIGPLCHRKDIGTAKLIEKRVDEMARLRSS